MGLPLSRPSLPGLGYESIADRPVSDLRLGHFPDRVMCTYVGHVRDTDGVPQAAEVIEKFRQLCPQLSPEYGEAAFPTFGPLTADAVLLAPSLLVGFQI
jgi:hypothetical protein